MAIASSKMPADLKPAAGAGEIKGLIIIRNFGHKYTYAYYQS